MFQTKWRQKSDEEYADGSVKVGAAMEAGSTCGRLPKSWSDSTSLSTISASLTCTRYWKAEWPPTSRVSECTCVERRKRERGREGRMSGRREREGEEGGKSVR